MKYFFLLLGMLFLISSCSSSKTTIKKERSPGFPFVKSETLTDIIELAKQENKLVFVDVTTEWCLPCKVMDEEVFTDKNIIKHFDQNFISYKVDAEKGNGPNLSFLYSVKEYPTLLFLDINGRELQRNNGAVSQSELMQMAKKSIEIKVSR